MIRHRCLLLFLLVPGAALPAAGGDWPQWLGPLRNGVYEGAPLATQWPGGAPPVLWSHEVGEGWSAPIVVDGKVVIYHRQGDRDVVECLDGATGRGIWKKTFATDYKDQFGFDNGPRATPAAVGGRLYLFSAAGVLRALELADGGTVWEVDTHRKFEVPQGFFGAAGSPLVEGGKVFLNIGGSKMGAGLVAFEAGTGEVVWKATKHEASYASAVAATLGGKRWVLFFDREGLVQVDPEAGRVFYTFPLRARSRATVNAASPLLLGERVFVSASYQVGAALLDLSEKGPEVIWSNRLSLNSHYTTAVAKDGLIFGVHGRQESRPALRSIRAEDGEVLWSQERFGAASLVLAGELLLVLREDGDLLLLPASAEGFKVLTQVRILEATVRAYPALADGILYARDERKLIAADLRRPKPAPETSREPAKEAKTGP